MNQYIYKIKNINIKNLKNDSSLDTWYNQMIKKKVDELSLLDISRMLRQDIYGDIALPLAVRILIRNPLEGEMYEGQLLELMIKYITNHQECKKGIDYPLLSLAIDYALNTMEWDFEEDKEEYKDLVKQLEQLFEIN